jgi:hypothetical protein
MIKATNEWMGAILTTTFGAPKASHGGKRRKIKNLFIVADSGYAMWLLALMLHWFIAEIQLS